MATTERAQPADTVAGLWRYPVKSMGGEALGAAPVGERGLLGDRAYAVLDVSTGHVASAKHPRKWAALLACRAAFAEEPRPGAPLPPVLITLPDGALVSSAQPDISRILSRALGREVALVSEAPAQPTREANRAPAEADPAEEAIREEPLALAAPPGSFFDYAVLHLITTATLAVLQQRHPEGQFAPRRFRPNILVAPADAAPRFAENDWIGRALALGGQIQLQVIDPCPRCVITTLPQGELPHDRGILRTIARENAATSATLAPGVMMTGVAGVYASVARGGVVRVGDAIALREAGQA
jgi:uncharacterized protein YcbX